jgi:hypothetical protein
MFDKIFPWAFFFNWMPYPRRFSWFGPSFVFWYGRSIYKPYQDAVIRYYKAQLRELDIKYKIAEAGLTLISSREEAIRNGIGPADPEYPSLQDVLNNPDRN